MGIEWVETQTDFREHEKTHGVVHLLVPNRELQVIQHHRCSVGFAVFYVERTHYIGIRTFRAMWRWNQLIHVRLERACYVMALEKWSQQQDRSSNNLLLSAGSSSHDAGKNVDQRNHRLGWEVSNRFFSPQPISEVSFVANESCPTGVWCVPCLESQEPYFQSDLPPQEDVTDAPVCFCFPFFKQWIIMRSIIFSFRMRH